MQAKIHKLIAKYETLHQRYVEQERHFEASTVEEIIIKLNKICADAKETKNHER